MLHLLHFNLTRNGLMLIFQEEQQITSLTCNPFTTCALLYTSGAIESFDSNGHEPVVYYHHPPYYHWAKGMSWQQFVHCYPFTKKEALHLLTQLKKRNNTALFNATPCYISQLINQNNYDHEY